MKLIKHILCISPQDKLFLLEEDSIISGRGRSPYDPISPCTSTLSGKTQLPNSCVCFCFSWRIVEKIWPLTQFFKKAQHCHLVATHFKLATNSESVLALSLNKSPCVFIRRRALHRPVHRLLGEWWSFVSTQQPHVHAHWEEWQGAAQRLVYRNNSI